MTTVHKEIQHYYTGNGLLSVKNTDEAIETANRMSENNQPTLIHFHSAVITCRQESHYLVCPEQPFPEGPGTSDPENPW